VNEPQGPPDPIEELLGRAGDIPPDEGPDPDDDDAEGDPADLTEDD